MRVNETDLGFYVSLTYNGAINEKDMKQRLENMVYAMTLVHNVKVIALHSELKVVFNEKEKV